MPNCFKCKAQIGFKKDPQGKWYPTDPDGRDHRDTCQYAEKWRRENVVEKKVQREITEFA